LVLLGSRNILHVIRIRVKRLGKKDIIVNGGTYDFDSNADKNKSALVHMPQFAQKFTNTNIIMVNITLRHDVAMNSEINLEI